MENWKGWKIEGKKFLTTFPFIHFSKELEFRYERIKKPNKTLSAPQEGRFKHILEY